MATSKKSAKKSVKATKNPITTDKNGIITHFDDVAIVADGLSPIFAEKVGSELLVVGVSVFKDKYRSLSVRRFYSNTDGEEEQWLPGRAGVTIPAKNVDSFLKALSANKSLIKDNLAE